MSKPSDPSSEPGIQQLDILNIPGWVRDIQPSGLAFAGVSIAVAEGDSRGMRCVIDPWPDSRAGVPALAINDTLRLFVNARAVATKVIEPGEENQQIALYVPTGTLINGVNDIQHKVERISGNPDESPVFKLLFYRPGPLGLNLVLPQDVLSNGVSAARAAQGVVCQCFYSAPRPFDKVRLTGGATFEDHLVGAPGQASPIEFTLGTAFFRRAGDNPAAPFFFVADDQLGNRAQSAPVDIDIHLDRVELDLRAPRVLEARENNGTQINFGAHFYYADFATVQVSYTGSAPGQSVKVYCVGRNHTYGSEIQNITSVGQTLSFFVPRLEVVDSIGERMKFYYTVRLSGETQDRPSLDLFVDVTPQTLRLIEPTINGAGNNIRAYHPGLVGQHSVRLRLTNAANHSDTRDSAEFAITPGAASTDIAVPQAWRTEFAGRDVIFNYTLRKTGTGENIQFSWCLRMRATMKVEHQPTTSKSGLSKAVFYLVVFKLGHGDE